ncbi:MAG: type IV secretion system DNA-binding domain-containing protein [Solirubrobacteraceae bacterium]
MSPPNENVPYQEPDPLAPPAHLAQWLVATTEHVAVGVLLGLLAARLMRRWHLHWSWAAGASALVLLGRTLPAGEAMTLGVAALGAAIRGRRWHGEDLQAGADLAEIAAGRTTPLDGLRAGIRGARSWLAGLAGRADARREGVHSWLLVGAGSGRLGSWFTSTPAAGGRGEHVWRDSHLSVGVDRRGRSAAIELGEERGGTHTLVAGATGSGKTFTQAWITMAAVAYGMSAIVVDPKGDAGLRGRLHRAARAAGKAFYMWTPEGPVVYNPYARGGETEIADKALAGERFTEPHYQRQAQRYLGHAVRALRATGREVSLAGLVEALDPAALELLARELHEEQARAVHAYLDSLTTRQRSDLSGVRDRLAIMAESDVGPWLDPATPDADSIELLDTVRSGAVVYYSLRADARPLLAHMLGSAIVQDLQTVVSALQERPARCVVAIDEFSAIAAEHVAGLFARARSAGISLLLGTQELSDLRLPGREMLQEQVLGNLTSVIAHRQAVPASAELIARLSGSRGAWRTTVSSNGRTTRTRVSEPLISSEEVMSLPTGHAAVIRLSSPRSAVIARMHSPDRNL